MILIVLAAGIGSRFGKKTKQLQKIGPNNEFIIDYSIHDALKAGFDEIIFIIRKDIEEEFKQTIGNRIEKLCNVKYVYQEINIKNRTKPLGTGHALLCCKDFITKPFAIINADDYYGPEAFKLLYNNLKNNISTCIGYQLQNTVSSNGTVTRGICNTKENILVNILETHEIYKENNQYYSKENIILNDTTIVSMNMWGFMPNFIKQLENEFKEFMENIKDIENDEFLIPIVVNKLLINKQLKIKIKQTTQKWFGMTYEEDIKDVIENINRLIDDNVYNKDLWGDFKCI